MNAFLDPTASPRAGEELDLTRLTPWLSSRWGAGAVGVEQFPRGHSNLTYLIRIGSRELVLRRPPFGSKVATAHDMSREYRVLSRLHAIYPPAPRALDYCEDDSVLGAPFYVMERVRGVILRRDLPPGMELSSRQVERLGQAFIQNLAALHRLDYASVGLAELGKPQGYVARQVKGWIERYHGSRTHPIPEVEPVSEWLLHHLSAESPETGAALIHNDYKYDNLVLDSRDPTRIVGLLDWEMSTLGDPLMDLGTALGYWVEASDPEELRQVRMQPTTLPGSPTRAELAGMYAELAGRPLSNIVFYYVFALFKIAVIVQQIYYRYHHALTGDERFASLIEMTRVLMRAALRAARRGAL